MLGIQIIMHDSTYSKVSYIWQDIRLIVFVVVCGIGCVVSLDDCCKFSSCEIDIYYRRVFSITLKYHNKFTVS